jgi:dipeptidyl aminopeptidase/acylaminoacyl peptidase
MCCGSFFMPPDIRNTLRFQHVEELVQRVRRPGKDAVSDAADLHVCPDGTHAVFTGTICESLEGSLPTRICEVNLRTGAMRVLTQGGHSDRSPRYSPNGKRIAFVSDREAAGDFQLYLLDRLTGEVSPAPRVRGWIEYLRWSPDGTRLLLGVAGHGADVAGGQGAVTSRQHREEAPSWLPAVETGNEEFRRRTAWTYDLASGAMREVSTATWNIWEANWCGTDAIVAVVTKGAGEGDWYRAQLATIDIASSEVRVLYSPRDQIGWPSASSDGRSVAFVEAVCSDRWIVAGDLKLLDVESGSVEHARTGGADISFVEWVSGHTVLVAGLRGAETVVGYFDLPTRGFREVWSSTEISTGGFGVAVASAGPAGDSALVGEGFKRAPEIAVIAEGLYRPVCSLDRGYQQAAEAIHDIRSIRWRAPDGLEIQGWLLLPSGTPPFASVLSIHGGPVGNWRPTFLARRYMPLLALLAMGYAVFLPNPRGSSGRGRDFAHRVVGDLGGADTHDHLSGLDHLVAEGIVDLTRIGVTGVSYGGFMSAWLVTQDRRFSACVPVAPACNHVTAHLLSNIPDFVAIFLDDHYSNPSGKYFSRSPVTFAERVRTPTLNICGALDRCTPPEEAAQFHSALRERGVPSVLVTYPEEGHGVRSYPAAIDYAARMAAWFEEHMPP